MTAYATLLVVLPASLVSAQDPCDSNLLMAELEDGRRHPDVTTSFETANICDYQLDECLYNNHYVCCYCFSKVYFTFASLKTFASLHIRYHDFWRYINLCVCVYVCIRRCGPIVAKN